jgi:hypothetical protein
MATAVRTTHDADVVFEVAAFLEKVGAGKTIAKFKKNDVIFSQGDDAASICFIHALLNAVLHEKPSLCADDDV